MIKSITEIKARYAETDKMGVIHHRNYFVWLEMGRIQMLNELGLPYDKFEAQGYGLPVVEANISYKSPAFFNDTIFVHSFIKTQPTLRIRIEYELFREEKQICQASTLHAFVKANGKPIRPPLNFVQVVKAHLK